MVEVTELTTRAQFRTFAQMVKLVGPSFARLITQGGAVEIGGKRYSIMAAMMVKEARGELLQQGLQYLETLDVDTLIEFCDGLLMNHCTVNGVPFTVDASRTAEERRELCGIYIDENFQDAWQLIGAIRLAAMLNFNPSTAGDTSADSSAGSTGASEPCPPETTGETELTSSPSPPM